MAASDRIIPWWEHGVIYQIYPRSFQDSDGDGIGDLAGIERRLDYVAALGVDAIWLSPIFPSPMADFGYDVSDYCGIEPIFGDLAGFDRLLAAVHSRGLSSSSISSPTTAPTSMSGFAKAARRATTPSETGTSGVTRRLAAGRRTTGSATSVAPPGNGTRRQANIIFTPS